MKTRPDNNDLPAYAPNYSVAKLWTKLSKAAILLGKKSTWYVLVLFYTLQSPDVSAKNKALIMGALGYLILPTDLIPDLIPLLGFTDDIAAIKIAYDAIKASVTPDIEQKADAKLAEWFRN